MKNLVHSLIALFLIFSSTGAMDNPDAAKAAKKTSGILSWPESFFPGTFATAEKSTEAFKKISEDGLVVKHDLTDFTHDLSRDGVKHVMDPNSIKQLNAASNNMAKTWITAGAGGALTLAGLILLLHTLMIKTEDKDASEQTWYMRILSNRYVISALLMASGITLILKSDTLVAKSA